MSGGRGACCCVGSGGGEGSGARVVVGGGGDDDGSRRCCGAAALVGDDVVDLVRTGFGGGDCDCAVQPQLIDVASAFEELQSLALGAYCPMTGCT